MEKIFELLKQRSINTPDRIIKQIMSNYSFSNILELNLELLLKIPIIEKEKHDLGVFDFVADSDMTAQHSTCPEWECRLSRILETAKFAALYCDTLYIPNYFEDYFELRKMKKIDSRELERLRYRFAGDLMILLALRPLFNSGIVKIANRKFHICKGCAEKLALQTTARKIERVIDELNKGYIKLCKVKLLKSEKNILFSEFVFDVDGPEELYEKGGSLYAMPKIPPWLLGKSKLLKNEKNKEYALNYNDMKRLGIPKVNLMKIADDIFYQHLLSMLMNTKYLTHREIDMKVLTAITKDQQLCEYNDILSSELICSIPIFKNASLSSILYLRNQDYEEFLVFRNSLSNIIKDYLSKRKSFTRKDARAVYQDMVYPELCKLNAKSKSLRNGAIFKNTKDVVVTSGILSFGLCSGLLPLSAKPLLATIGGFEISRELIKSITSIFETPDEIRNHNFFFLWKLAKKK